MTPTTFHIGDRVTFNARPADTLDKQKVVGRIVRIVHNRALVRLDEPIVRTVVVTTPFLRELELEKETDGQAV